MVMPSGRFNANRAPLVNAVQHMESIKELIRAERRKDYITLLNFFDTKETISFCKSIYKCVKHNLVQREDYVWSLAMSRVAIKGDRAKMFSQTVAGLLVPEFYGGNSVSGNGNRKAKSTADNE
jgi:hypothetical protein